MKPVNKRGSAFQWTSKRCEVKEDELMVEYVPTDSFDKLLAPFMFRSIVPRSNDVLIKVHEFVRRKAVLRCLTVLVPLVLFLLIFEVFNESPLFWVLELTSAFVLGFGFAGTSMLIDRTILFWGIMNYKAGILVLFFILRMVARIPENLAINMSLPYLIYETILLVVLLKIVIQVDTLHLDKTNRKLLPSCVFLIFSSQYCAYYFLPAPDILYSFCIGRLCSDSHTIRGAASFQVALLFFECMLVYVYCPHGAYLTRAPLVVRGPGVYPMIEISEPFEVAPSNSGAGGEQARPHGSNHGSFSCFYFSTKKNRPLCVPFKFCPMWSWRSDYLHLWWHNHPYLYVLWLLISLVIPLVLSIILEDTDSLEYTLTLLVVLVGLLFNVPLHFATLDRTLAKLVMLTFEVWFLVGTFMAVQIVKHASHVKFKGVSWAPFPISFMVWTVSFVFILLLDAQHPNFKSSRARAFPLTICLMFFFLNFFQWYFDTSGQADQLLCLPLSPHCIRAGNLVMGHQVNLFIFLAQFAVRGWFTPGQLILTTYPMDIRQVDTETFQDTLNEDINIETKAQQSGVGSQLSSIPPPSRGDGRDD